MVKPGRTGKLSIVATLYGSAETVEEFCRRSLAAASRHFDDIEILLVNDGSPDNSLINALAIQEAEPRVVVVDLSRNFGHHKAMMSGLALAAGDYVFLIDSDLEEEPELITAFWERFQEGDCEVVFGVQESRRGGWFERITGNLFFWLVDRLSDEKLPRNLVTVRLMTRDYVRALVRHRDREFYISHLWLLTGFRQVAVPVRKLSLSPTTYSVALRVKMLVKYITTTSTRLLYMIFYTGFASALLAALGAIAIIIRYLSSGVATEGWTSLFVLILFLGGLQILILGIIGIYVANIFSETKRRPYAVIRAIHRHPSASNAQKKRA